MTLPINSNIADNDASSDASVQLSSQEAHFSEIAEAYVASRRKIPATKAYHEYWHDHIHRLVLLPKETAPEVFYQTAIYLDPMCGAGLFLDRVLDCYTNVWACDLSPEMLDYIEPDVRNRLQICQKADVRALPFEDNSVDVIVMRGGLHHVAFHMESTLKELYRVLKPGGQLIASEPLNLPGPVTWVRNWMYANTQIFDATEERGLTVEEMREQFQQAGFEHFYWEPFGHLSYALIGNTDFFPWFAWIRWPWVINAMIVFDEWSRKVPFWRQLCWLGNFRAQKP